MSKNFCVILAGGAGRRLWPASCEKMPKQFLDIFGMGETLLQSTYRRFVKFLDPDNIYVSTNVKYIDIVERQLPELPRRHILAEPVRLGTAPAVAWASSHIAYKEPDARIVFSPADQYITREDEFEKNIRHALDFVADHEVVVVMGVRPTMPATEYGYIQMGEQPDEKGLAPVKSFTENLMILSQRCSWRAENFFGTPVFMFGMPIPFMLTWRNLSPTYFLISRNS